MTNYWLLKTEPETFSWNDLLKNKKATWDGVRNFQARKNLISMKLGDLAFFYHTGKNPEIVGIIKVIKESYPDVTDKTNKFVCVDVEFHSKITKPITLLEMKNESSLSDFILLKQSRLSVVPVTKKQWEIIMAI